MPNTGWWISKSLENVPGKKMPEKHAAYLAARLARVKKDADAVTREKELVAQRPRSEIVTGNRCVAVAGSAGRRPVEHRKWTEDARVTTTSLQRANLGRPAGPAFRRCIMVGPDEKLKPWMSNLTVLEAVYCAVNDAGKNNVGRCFEPFSSYAEVVITQADANPYSGKSEIHMNLISYPRENVPFVDQDARKKDVAWSTFYDKFVLQDGVLPWKSGGRMPGKDAWVVPAKRMWDLVRWSFRVRPYALLWLENHAKLEYGEDSPGRKSDLACFKSDFVEAQ